MSLATKMKKAEIQIGDVVEIISVADSLSDAISDAIDEPRMIMEGWLVEITGLGEQNVLGFALHGSHVLYPPNGPVKYGDLTWSRIYEHEQCFGAATYFKLVGRKTLSGCYVWDCPDLVNVYTRCQTYEPEDVYP